MDKSQLKQDQRKQGQQKRGSARPTDPRVIRTRQMLRDALIALILEHGYDAISIGDITERAGLRRATFYLHYGDKEELLFTMLQETFDELVRNLDRVASKAFSREKMLAGDLIIFRHAQDNADLYRTILGGHGAALILRYVREYMAADFRRHLLSLPEKAIPIPIDVLVNYLTAAKLNTVTWWLEAGMPYPPERMAEMCTDLALNGLLRVFGAAAETLL